MTTTSTATGGPFGERKFLHSCLALFGVVLVASLYKPAMMFDWCLENLLVVALVAALLATYSRYPLSDLSYLLIAVYLCLHEWGANHKYADVPLGEWMKTWFHTNRNHYDRFMHLAFGLCLSYPVREVLLRWSGVRGTWQYYLPVDVALALGACYEMMEAMVASIVSPEAGEAFVGMQGDMWDAQKDMAFGGIGALVAMGVTWFAKRMRA